MKKFRHIVCTDHSSSSGRSLVKAIWPLSNEVDWAEDTGVFDLLGGNSQLAHIFTNGSARSCVEDSKSVGVLRNSQDGLRRVGISDQGGNPLDQIGALLNGSNGDVKKKLTQLLHAMWFVFGYEPKTIDQGIQWLGTEVVTRCLVVADVFALLENKKNVLFDAEMLWQHSLRTGYLSGVLAKEENGDITLIVQSCLAGFSHDIGLAILAVSHDSSRYLDVMACARRRSLSLASAELLVLGISHEIVGSEYLQRRRFPKEVVDAVSFHDEPLGCDSSGLTPTIAVYAANLLDGGGWPQDSDGVPSERSRQYLSSRGFMDPWPKWHQYVEVLQRLDFSRV